MTVSRRSIILLVFAIVVLIGMGLLLLLNSNKAPVSFAPPYPELDSTSSPIFAVFEGRVPCTIPGCDRLKVQLVLYRNKTTQQPTTYWLGLIGSQGNDRLVSQGTWTSRIGIAEYPEAIVYDLDANAEQDFRHYWRVTDDVMLVLDKNLNPKPGTAGWGYMLSRYDAPYGPRTYDTQ